MKFQKKGNVLAGKTMGVVFGFLGIILLLMLSAELIPEAVTAIGAVGNISNLPLAGLFTGGLITMIIVIVIIVAVIKGAGSIAK